MNTVAPTAQAAADLALLLELVSIQSVSGDESRAVERFVSAARDRGFEADTDEVGNAIAHTGAPPHDTRVHIVLLGHIDTVPGDITVGIADGYLHGRGSVDAKGPLCAMLAAADRATLPQGVRLTVAGAVGEESPESPGARHLAQGIPPHACIIAEPSGWDGVTLGYKGRLLARATTTADNAHSAGPDGSPADELLRWWNHVLRHIQTHNTNREGVFDTIQATVQSMSSQGNGLTQSATIETDFRLPLSIDPNKFTRTLAELAAPSMRIECLGAERAHRTDRNDAVVRALCGAIRANGGRPRPKVKSGTADLNVVAPIWRCPIAAYGPGDSGLDHTPHERLAIADFERSIDVLTDAIERLATELCQPSHSPDRRSRMSR